MRRSGESHVEIVERLQIGKLNHYKKGLLKKIEDRGGSSKDLIEALLYKLWHSYWEKDRAADTDSDTPESARAASGSGSRLPARIA